MEENGNLNEKLLDSRPSRSRQRKWSVRGSWRSTVWLGAFLASLVLVINASVLAWVYAKYEVEGGIATIFEGSLHHFSTMSKAEQPRFLQRHEEHFDLYPPCDQHLGHHTSFREQQLLSTLVLAHAQGY